MQRIFHKELGFYIPAFFEMHIDTDSDDMTINKLSIKDMTVLFHEYIHFIQDFTTFYGLNIIFVYCEYMHSIINRIYKNGKGPFIVPFDIQDNNDNVILNCQINKLTQGDYTDIPNFEIKSIQEDYDKLIDNHTLNKIPTVIIETSEGDVLTFGSIAIEENMAYLMEKCCSPLGVVSSPQFPYCAAEKIADYYVPNFSSEPLMVIALCDTTLQCSIPGTRFVRTMKNIKNGQLKFKKPEDVYDYFYKQQTVKVDGTKSTLLDSYLSILHVVGQELKSYIKDMPITASYYQWIDSLITFATDWRKNDRYYLLKMARCNDLLKNSYWGKAIHDVGTPLMTNNRGHYFKIVPERVSKEMNVEYFKTFYQIEQLFSQGKMGCDSYDWCNNSPCVTPNNLCKTSPWERCKELQLCPYGLLWRHWNLTDYIPIRKI